MNKLAVIQYARMVRRVQASKEMDMLFSRPRHMGGWQTEVFVQDLVKAKDLSGEKLLLHLFEMVAIHPDQWMMYVLSEIELPDHSEHIFDCPMCREDKDYFDPIVIGVDGWEKVVRHILDKHPKRAAEYWSVAQGFLEYALRTTNNTRKEEDLE